MDGGGVKSGCGPGLRFKPLANRSASCPCCQRRASRASWGSITQCQGPNRIRRFTRTGPSTAHTAVRPTGSSCCSAWAERAMTASSSPPTQPARPHWRTISGSADPSPHPDAALVTASFSGPRCLRARSRIAEDLTSLALAGRSNPRRCQLFSCPRRPCHPRATSSGFERYLADSHGHSKRAIALGAGH
jgi:hypothetical protein